MWRNYLVMEPRKLDNVYVIESIDPNEENSEILQWNEYHAQQFNDFYHAVHKYDRILKINGMACTNTPALPPFGEDPIQACMNNSESLTLVVQKRDLSKEMQIMQIDI